MSVLVAEGFDVYDTEQAGAENSLSGRPQWSIVNNGGSYYFPVGLAGSGRVLHMLVGGGVAGRFLQTTCTLIASKQELCVGGLFSFSVQDAAARAFDDMVLLTDTVSGETISLSLNVFGNLVLSSSLSGQSFIDPAVSLPDEHHFYEIEIQGGTATLFSDNLSLGSISVGGVVNFDQIDLFAKLDPPSDKNQSVFIDDFYITDFLGAEFVGRLGPIGIVPLIPSSDGVFGTDMTPVPDDGTKYDKVDDNAGGNPTDKDTTHVTGVGDGVTQTFFCAAERSFTGNALGFLISASCKSGLATDDTLDLLVRSGAQETVESGFSVPVAAWRLRVSNVFTSLPDGAAMSQANLEAAEFGLRLIKP